MTKVKSSFIVVGVAVALSLLLSPTLHARSKFQTYIERGGMVLPGTTSYIQRSCRGATANVYLVGTSTPATIYDVNDNVISFSRTADAAGSIEFYGSESSYDLVISGGGCVAHRRTIASTTGGSGGNTVNITDFGCVGDGVTDNTTCIQAAIDSLPDYTATHPDYANLVTAGGGIVDVPSGKFRVTGTIYYKSAVWIRGLHMWSSGIYHQPSVAGTDLFSPELGSYAGLNGHHGFRISDLAIFGTANSNDAIHIDRTRNFNAEGLFVQYFRGSGIRINYTAGTYGFYHTLTNVTLVNNCDAGDKDTCANLFVDGTANVGKVSGGLIGGTSSAATAAGMTMADYLIVIKANGWSFDGISIEGEPNLAMIYDKSLAGTSVSNYTETGVGTAKPFMVRSLPVNATSTNTSSGSSGFINIAHASAASLVKFENFDQSTADSNQYSHLAALGYFIGNPQRVSVFKDGSFHHGNRISATTGWQVSANHSTVNTNTVRTFASRASLEFIHSGDNVGHTQYINIGDELKPYLYKRLYITAMIYEPDGTTGYGERFYTNSAGNIRTSWPAADFGNFWKLYVIDIPVTAAATATDGSTLLVFTQPGTVTAGDDVYLTNLTAWIGGFPLIYGEDFIGQVDGPDTTVGSAAPTTGVWHVGNIVWDSDAAAGATPGWYVTAAGTFSTYSQTCDTTNTSPTLTNCASTTGVGPGDYVTVSAGFAGTKRVLSKTSTTLVLNANATSSNVGATVATPDPVFTAMAVMP
jgi:hypothetical protein